jgi:hypothetical protein
LSSFRPIQAEVGDVWFNSGTEAHIGFADKRGLAGRLAKRQGLAQTLAYQPNKLTSSEHDLTSGSIRKRMYRLANRLP